MLNVFNLTGRLSSESKQTLSLLQLVGWAPPLVLKVLIVLFDGGTATPVAPVFCGRCSFICSERRPAVRRLSRRQRQEKLPESLLHICRMLSFTSI